MVAEPADPRDQQPGELPHQPGREEPVALLLPDTRTDEALVAEQPEAHMGLGAGAAHAGRRLGGEQFDPTQVLGIDEPVLPGLTSRSGAP